MQRTNKTSVLIKSTSSKSLFYDIRGLIEKARDHVAQAVNSGLTMLYWQIGRRIFQENLEGKRAQYGMRIVVNLATGLSSEYGSNFSEKNLRRMIQFYEAFPDEKIVVSLIRQLSWTHFLRLIPIEDSLKRDFYAGMCRVENWSVTCQTANGIKHE
ncbi:MAG: hypothetical protein COV46_04835 [Deltaproteobacteria bacterium CG11_big_fil_rev_8_21_14_0_20_49_13]|nr:MAG: hypothetical protein COV46_04835 [Deltaproteobacteria bacterium CG11_big_fil_rev_8_21_14_0_20_49_13]